MSRRLFRKPNGEFKRGTLADLGVQCEWCQKCGRGNPAKIGEPAPTKCHACGTDLKPTPEAP